MFLEYGEESMLTLGARLVSNMNVVRDNQVVGYFLNLENTCVLTSSLEVMFTAEDIWNEDQGSILNFCSIFVMRRRLRIWPNVRRILQRD